MAEITGRSPGACRQLAASARRRTRAARALGGIDDPPAQQPVVVRNFKRAWEAADIGALIGLLGVRRNDPDRSRRFLLSLRPSAGFAAFQQLTASPARAQGCPQPKPRALALQQPEGSKCEQGEHLVRLASPTTGLA